MGIERTSDSVLAQAVRIAGSQSEFGRWIGKRQSTVFEWLDKGKPLPAEHVLTVERKSGIPRHRLRPDLYPVDEQAPHEVVHLPVSRLGGSCDRAAKTQLGEPVR